MHSILTDLLSIRDVDQVGILIALISLEVLLARALGRKYFKLEDSFCSVSMGLFYAVSIAAVAGTVLFVFHWVRGFAFVEVDWTSSTGRILPAYVPVDCLFSVYHRAIHEVRLGGAAHVNHHSSGFLNTGTGLRSCVVDDARSHPLHIPHLLL